MNNCISKTYVIEIVWEIKNIPGYGFGKDKNLYNLITGKKIKLTLNNRSKGYWIKRKFYSCHFLKNYNMLLRPKNLDLPF